MHEIEASVNVDAVRPTLCSAVEQKGYEWTMNRFKKVPPRTSTDNEMIRRMPYGRR